MRALQLLSQVRFKSPKNPYWLAVLSIETMCRHDVGDSARRIPRAVALG